jgi:hypothetical protein
MQSEALVRNRIYPHPCLRLAISTIPSHTSYCIHVVASTGCNTSSSELRICISINACRTGRSCCGDDGKRWAATFSLHHPASKQTNEANHFCFVLMTAWELVAEVIVGRGCAPQRHLLFFLFGRSKQICRRMREVVAFADIVLFKWGEPCLALTHTTMIHVRCSKRCRERLGFVLPNRLEEAVTGDTQESTGLSLLT